ncbi:MAG: type II toxin-antitoxin system Phd/YefM family antitoxin [Spirochaetes bacterium]|nr:type II toxin-antitoxin system Phd/YefM family antitoxin [Spirochaetota bacterium]
MKTELVTSLKRKATKIIGDLAKKREPVLITEHGKPAAYLVDVETFEHIEEKIRILEGIARGERDFREGKTYTVAEAKKKMVKWLK